MYYETHIDIEQAFCLGANGRARIPDDWHDLTAPIAVPTQWSTYIISSPRLFELALIWPMGVRDDTCNVRCCFSLRNAVALEHGTCYDNSYVRPSLCHNNNNNNNNYINVRCHTGALWRNIQMSAQTCWQHTVVWLASLTGICMKLLMVCSHRRRGRDKTVVSSRRRCEQAINPTQQLSSHVSTTWLQKQIATIAAPSYRQN